MNKVQKISEGFFIYTAEGTNYSQPVNKYNDLAMALAAALASSPKLSV